MYQRHKYKETSDWKLIPDAAASRKRDGASFFMVFDKEGNPSFISRRRGVQGNFPDRTANVPHLVKQIPQYAGNVYNVELVQTGKHIDGHDNHPMLSGMLNANPDNSHAMQKEHGPIRAVIFDVINPKIDTYGEKLNHINQLAEDYNKPGLVQANPVKIGEKNIQGLIDSTKKLGQEGVIITSLTTPELANHRIKIKHVNTYNLKVSRVNQEFSKDGKPKDSMGSITVVDSTGREVANVGTGFTREMREDIWKNRKDWVDKPVQVKARNPHRTKLIAPVYNGEPDGRIDMIKSSSALQDQLLENLIKTYQGKGVNLQKILDNPMFQQLPLDKKVQFIQSNASTLSTEPSLNLGTIATGVVGGGIAGTIALALHSAVQGASAAPFARGTALGVGATLGGTAALIRAYMDKKRDQATVNSIQSGQPIQTLIDRSGSKPVEGSPLGVNRYLSRIEGFIEKELPIMSYNVGKA